MSSRPPTPPPKTEESSNPMQRPRSPGGISPKSERTVPSPNRRARNVSSTSTETAHAYPPHEENGRPFPFNHTVHSRSSSSQPGILCNAGAPHLAGSPRTASTGFAASQAVLERFPSSSPSSTSPEPSPGLRGASISGNLEITTTDDAGGPERSASGSRWGRTVSDLSRRRGSAGSRRLSGTGDSGSPRGLESPLSSGSENTTSTPFRNMSRADSETSQLSISNLSDMSNASSLKGLDAFVTPNEVYEAREDPFDDVQEDMEDGPREQRSSSLTDQTPMDERGDPMASAGAGDVLGSWSNAAAGGGPSTQAARIAREAALASPFINQSESFARGRDAEAVEEEGVEDVNPEEEESGDEGPVTTSHPPILNRSFSSPLPNRVGHLRHPRALRGTSGLRHASVGQQDMWPVPALPTRDSAGTSTTTSSASSPSALEAVSLELADSLQSAIQTLLHLSPPHLLDNAKEQYAACTVQLPTTSLSAILTAMRKLNYLSANLHALCDDEAPPISGGIRLDVPEPRDPDDVARSVDETVQQSNATSSPTHPHGLLEHGLRSAEDFDIGEMLQSTADLLSGQASQAGIDLVLFHGDVGIKHISVAGDGEGLGYALSHVIRQILMIGRPGDALELGLQVAPQSPSLTPRVNQPLTAAEIDQSRKNPDQPFSEEDSGTTSPGETHHDTVNGPDAGPLLLTFQIVHNMIGEDEIPLHAIIETPRAEKAEPIMLQQRQDPDFQGLLCKRILRHVNATLRVVKEDSGNYLGFPMGPQRRAYEVSILLARGTPIEEPALLTTEEQAARQPYPSVQLAREPTLTELSHFTEKLRGKKVELHASLRSIFARHVTSYLAAWGMDVSHFPLEENADLHGDASEFSHIMQDDQPPTFARDFSGRNDRYVIIDDDVAALRHQLLKVRSEIPVLQFRPKINKRPTMSNRTKSSPQVRAIQDSLPIQMPSMHTQPTVMIHFTSLANYNHVRDVVSTILASTPPSSYPPPPDVLVIPKPIGPRRFLTTLHTAINRPLIDPFFAPIANSPRSPGGGYFPGIGPRTPNGQETLQRSEYLSSGAGLPLADVGGYIGAGQGTEPNASPALSNASNTSSTKRQLKTPAGDVLATPAVEYFNDAATKLGGPAASGVMVQSPDGRPYGMYFEPPTRDSPRRSMPTPRTELRRRPSTRSQVATGVEGRAPTAASPTQRRLSGMSAVSAGDPERKSALQPVMDEEESTDTSAVPTPAPMTRTSSLRRKTTGLSGHGLMSPSQRRDRSDTALDDASRPTQEVVAPEFRGPTSPTTSRNGDNTPTAEPAPPSKKAMAIEARKRAQAEAAAAAAMVEAQRIKAAPPVIKKSAAAGKSGLIAPPINVLIVEDNPINQNILSMFLRKKKIKHQAANNGQEAVDKWRTGTFHLILMDIQLPVMDGIEATKEIRRMEKSSNIGVFPNTPNQELNRTLSPANEYPPGTPFRSSVIIVALTASSYQTDRVNALAAGCNDFLTKPVSLPWLEAKIVEWGCMQALIDFEGWRKWRTSDNKDNKSLAESKRNFLATSEAKAKMVAKGLTINRSARMLRVLPTDEPPPPPPAPTPDVGGSSSLTVEGITINVTHPSPGAIEHQSDPEHSTLPAVPEGPVVPGDTGISGVQVLTDGLRTAKADEDATGGRKQAPARPVGIALDESPEVNAPRSSSYNDGNITPMPPKPRAIPSASDRAKSTEIRPVSPDIVGPEGDADEGCLPNSEPSSEVTPSDHADTPERGGPDVVVYDTEHPQASGQTTRIQIGPSTTEKPLPPLPE